MSGPEALGRRVRFSRAERWTHRAVAVLAGTCIVTALALYVPDVSVRVGNRPPWSNVHVVAGLLLPLPLALALLDRTFRSDAAALDRWTAADRRWLRSR